MHRFFFFVVVFDPFLWWWHKGKQVWNQMQDRMRYNMKYSVQKDNKQKDTIKDNRSKSKTNDWNNKICTPARNRRSLQLTPWFTRLPSFMCCWWRHNYATASWKSLNNGVTQKKIDCCFDTQKAANSQADGRHTRRGCCTGTQPPWKLPHSKAQFVCAFKMCASNLSKVHPVRLWLSLLQQKHALVASVACFMWHLKQRQDAIKHR